MRYEMKLLRKKYKQENGKIFFCTVKYPVFSLEEESDGAGLEQICGFYEDFASRLCSAVEKGVLLPLTDKYSAETVTLEAETCVSVCTSDEISTYTDVRHYADRTLVTLLRRSQSWQRKEAVSHHRKEVSWLLCGLPKLSPEVKKAAKTAGVMPPDGFYATDGKTVLYRCFFKEGDGAGLRRSAEKRFISEYAFDRRGDITQNR